MKNLKYILAVFALVPLGFVFADWTAPTAVPPGNNTQPPINIGNVLQYKRGTIGAYKFCIYDTSGREVSCLGGGAPNPSVFGDVLAGNQNINHLTKWMDGSNKKITESAFYESDDGKKLCTVSGAGEVCFGRGEPGQSGTPGVPGIPGIAGSDGTVLTCGVSEKGKLLQWDGKGWICGDVGGGVAGVDTFDDVVKRGAVAAGDPNGYALTGHGIGVGGINIVGKMLLQDGTQGNGKILASDASGNASWKTKEELGLGGGSGCPAGQYLSGGSCKPVWSYVTSCKGANWDSTILCHRCGQAVSGATCIDTNDYAGLPNNGPAIVNYCRNTYAGNFSNPDSCDGGTTGGGVAGVSRIIAGSGISVSNGGTGEVTVTNTSSGGVVVSSYNNLPSGATAGSCATGNTLVTGSLPRVVRPAIAAVGGGLGQGSSINGCSCESGWSSLLMGASGSGQQSSLHWTCIKD
ncbi:MAG: hypothetical protein WCO84_04020 [bacterium]